jgi:hypothetical protein
MMISRRIFLQDMALVASAPALSNLLLISSTAQSKASAPPGSSPPKPAAEKVVFKIYGWDHECEDESKDHHVWMNINDSWRTAWR